MRRCATAVAEPAAPPLVTVERARFLFGTICTARVTAHDAAAEEATEAAFAALRRIEALGNNYRPESEISCLNRRGGGAWPVSEDLATLLRTGVALRDASNGRFDLGVWPLMQVWQRCVAEDRLPLSEEMASARAAGDTRHVHVDAAGTVRLERECPLDVSALVKGYALDAAAATLRRHGVEHAVLNAGGQLAVLAADEQPVPVEIVDPRDAARTVARLWTANRSVATSGCSENGWTVRGRLYGHLLDPRTGWPAPPRCCSATVLAPTGVEADGDATVAALLGPEAGLRFLAAHPGIEALWLVPGASPGTLRAVTTPGWIAATRMVWLAEE